MDDPLTCVNVASPPPPPDQKFGEIYCNYMGVLSFHCVLCPTTMDHSDEFILHYMIHFRDVFEIKQEQEESHVFEPDVAIAESQPISEPEPIKEEFQQALCTFVCSDVKSEPKYTDDNYSSTDQSFGEDVDTHRSTKRRKPKNSIKFTEPKKCGICGQTFVIKKLFKDHIRIHQSGPLPKYYQCDVCGRRVNQKKNLLTHIRRKHGQKVKCEMCGKMLRQHYMVAHLRRHNNERNNFDARRCVNRGRPKNSIKFAEPKKCGICGQTFVVRKLFKDHIRIHQSGPLPNSYECDICGRKATKMKNLIDHFRYKHTRKLKCEICKKMVRRNYMVAHIKRHNNERNFKCMLCDKAFVMAGDLTTHLKLHYSPTQVKVPSSKKFVEPQSCNVCGQKFIGISAYERHIQTHGTTPSLYECDICGRKVKEKKNLLSHMLFRHSRLPKVKAPCTICNKLFNRKYLNLHVRKHNMLDQKPSHMCPICGKTFLVSGDLSAHIRQHNRSVEAAPCTVCGKTFASPASLADHQRVHTGERPFACHICGSKFRTRSMLYVHRTIHLTEKNFACDICDMKFKNPAYVKTHKRKVHEKNRAPKKMRDSELTASVFKQFTYVKSNFNA